jgi:hypothetical protein
MNPKHEKFTEAEMLVGGLFTLGVDGICILIDLTGVGLAISPVLQGFVTFLMWWWLKSKGDPNAAKLGRQIAKYAANFLPVLPTTFITLGIEVYIHNHPEKYGVIAKAGALASGKPAGIASTADITRTVAAMGIPQAIE